MKRRYPRKAHVYRVGRVSGPSELPHRLRVRVRRRLQLRRPRLPHSSESISLRAIAKLIAVSQIVIYDPFIRTRDRYRARARESEYPRKLSLLIFRLETFRRKLQRDTGNQINHARLCGIGRREKFRSKLHARARTRSADVPYATHVHTIAVPRAQA